MSCSPALRPSRFILLLLVSLPVTAGGVVAQSNTTRSAPERGFTPGGSYAASEVETIDQQSGNLMLNLPLGSLPAGRGGLSAGLNLRYNSKIWDVESNVAEAETGGGSSALLVPSEEGGWNYGYRYELKDESDRDCGHSPYLYKFSIVLPDGGKRLLVLPGSTDLDGYVTDAPDGYSSPCQSTGPIARGDTLTFSTIDGTYLRLDVLGDGNANALDNQWILYLPDGTQVVHNPQPGSDILQRIYDRNNNYIDYLEKASDAAYGGHKTTSIKDQLGRAVVIEYEAAPGQDWVRSTGFAGEELITKVSWKNIVVRKVYQYYFNDEFHADNIRNPNMVFRMVDKVFLPAQVGALHYGFAYNADTTSNPTVGWGEVSEVQLPSGAKSNYSYLYDTGSGTPPAATAFRVMSNRPVRKTLTYNQEYDGASTPTTETWTYHTTFHNDTSRAVAAAATVATTSPAGSVSTDYFNFRDGYSLTSPPPNYASRYALVKSVAADGTTIERVYRNNAPAHASLLSGANPYVKYEFASIKDAAGTFLKTATKAFGYDKNGNVTSVAEYDFVNYLDVPRNAGRPTTPPNVAPQRLSVSSYYNPSPAADSNDYANPNIYALASSKRLRGLLFWSELRNADGTAFSRTERFYDDPNEKGNLTETKTWDSTKGGYSVELSAANSISITHQYDQYGNRTSMTDGRGAQTQITYGLITTPGGSVTGLYPTEVKTAYNTAVQRTAQSVHDFHTGLVTMEIDVDNGVSAETVYDALGRMKIAKTAVGTPLEAWVQTEYDDAARRVVTRADLYSREDGRKVSIQHFDQLGRVRLARTLEDAATQDALNEQHGIKVQTRYRTSGTETFSVISNPYRAATSAQATGEPGMGWTRSKADHTGRHREAETFAGASLPAPWGANTSSTGKVSTAVDANTKTVTDQAGRKRQGVTDALGRMIRVVEDPGGQNFITVYTFDIQDNLRQTAQGEEPNRQMRYFAYDSLKRVIRARQPEQDANSSLPPLTDPVTGHNVWSTSYTYDNNGNTLSTTDARGISVWGAYDALNRLTFRDYSDATPDVTFTYDDPNIARSKGELTRVWTGAATDALSITKYTAFDELGRATASEQTTGGQTFTFSNYSYYLSGELKSQTYPSGRIIEFAYDADGDLQQATGKRNAAAEARLYASGFSYTAAGAVERMRLGNGRWESANFNSRLQVSQINLGTTASDTSLLKLEMGYGPTAAENNGSLREQKISYAGLAQPMAQTYSYDSLNRLQATAETYNGGQQSWRQTYTYDRFGNRRFNLAQTTFPNTTQQAAKVVNPEIDAATNRLREQQDGDGVLDYDYDDAGNLTRDAEGKLFAYDAEGRQRSFGTNGSNSNGAKYAYDGQGKRVRKEVGTVVTLFVYDAFGQLAAEYENTPPQANGTRFITADHLGSPRVVTDEAGAVVSRHDYMAFGEEIFAGTASRTGDAKYSTFDNLRQQFTGYERDVESGLDYAQARYYHSRHGRFTSPDPLTASATIRDPQSFNRYSYALNSPYKFTDPLGLLSMYTTGANGRNWDAYSLGGAEGAFSNGFGGFHQNEEEEPDERKGVAEVTVTVVDEVGEDSQNSRVQPDTLTSNENVMSQFYCLFKKGGYGLKDTERAMWITKTDDGYDFVPWPWSASDKQETWTKRKPIPENTIGLAHTHPNRIPKPSTSGGNTGEGDFGASKQVRVPVYVLTRDAIWKQTSVGGKSVQTQVAGRDWWKPYQETKCND